MKSQLARHQAVAMDVERVKRAAWLEEGILVINPTTDGRLRWDERDLLSQIGDRLYGNPVEGRRRSVHARDGTGRDGKRG